MNRIIAIVGMCGSGKSVAVDYFLRQGYEKVYFGEVTFDKLKELKLDRTSENEKKMQKIIREEYGMGAYAILSVPKIKECLEEGSVIIDGLYSWQELAVLQENFPNNLITIAIVTDKNIRYERLTKRDYRPYFYDEAKSRDIFEIENVAKGGPIAYADYFVLNNGDIDAMTKRLDEILKQINNQRN